MESLKSFESRNRDKPREWLIQKLYECRTHLSETKAALNDALKEKAAETARADCFSRANDAAGELLEKHGLRPIPLILKYEVCCADSCEETWPDCEGCVDCAVKVEHKLVYQITIQSAGVVDFIGADFEWTHQQVLEVSDARTGKTLWPKEDD